MQNIDLSKIRKIFFIGIGGIGISALAKMALSRGMKVSGVNDEEGKTTDSLRESGIEVYLLPDLPAEALAKEGADLYVYSDAWIYRGPEVIEKAKVTGKPVLSYFEALGIFAKEYKVIAIAGTHGKTTTTAMVAEILVDAALDPTVVVGSFIKKFGSNFRKGSSEYLVVEADEYNRHFLNFNPFITLITNIEADHMDSYKDMADIESAFSQLAMQTDHFIVCSKSDPSTSFILNKDFGKYKAKIVNYAEYIEKVTQLSVPGVHNRMNAAAALAVADLLNINEEIVQKSLSEFSGTWRRLEKKGQTQEGTIIYDDYAHHPTEIVASLQALRELYKKGEKKITILFQPHLYSRTKALFDDFAKSFNGADRILLLPIYFAREDKDESISSEKLANAICANFLSGKEEAFVQAFPDFQSAEDFVLNLNLGPQDVFVTMGAGEAYKVADKIFKLI